MYYLRKEPYEQIFVKVINENGKVFPYREYMSDDRAIYKHHNDSRFYRGEFNGLSNKYIGMKVYTCKTLKKIMQIRQNMFDYCGELFDIYDENGKVDI